MWAFDACAWTLNMFSIFLCWHLIGESDKRAIHEIIKIAFFNMLTSTYKPFPCNEFYTNFYFFLRNLILNLKNLIIARNFLVVIKSKNARRVLLRNSCNLFMIFNKYDFTTTIFMRMHLSCALLYNQLLYVSLIMTCARRFYCMLHTNIS